MPKKGKTLIQPKVRLLLWIYFHEKECNSLSGIAKAIDYGKGNVKTHVVDLLDKGMIKSLSPDGEGPPYKITEKGVAFLKLLLLPRTVGIMAAILLAALTIICFVAFSDKYKREYVSIPRRLSIPSPIFSRKTIWFV